MDAMTMSCKVDDVPVLKRVKAADEIMATVYDGNIALHEVVVMPKPAGHTKSKMCAGNRSDEASSPRRSLVSTGNAGKCFYRYRPMRVRKK